MLSRVLGRVFGRVPARPAKRSRTLASQGQWLGLHHLVIEPGLGLDRIGRPGSIELPIRL